MATAFGIDRITQDRMGLASLAKAIAAQNAGFFDAEITPVTIHRKRGDAVVVAKDEHPRETSLEALARLKGTVRPDGTGTAGVSSRLMGIGPAPATRKVLALTGMTLAPLDWIELNEAFAAQGLAVPRDLGLRDDDPRVDPNRGAIARGHPLGASGAVLERT